MCCSASAHPTPGVRVDASSEAPRPLLGLRSRWEKGSVLKTTSRQFESCLFHAKPWGSKGSPQRPLLSSEILRDMLCESDSTLKILPAPDPHIPCPPNTPKNEFSGCR